MSGIADDCGGPARKILTDNGGSAFPYEERNGDGFPIRDYFGMTLRDYFAAKAMPTHLQAIGSAHWCSAEDCAAEVAKLAYISADAMLAERAK